ncbi:neuronal membrane glycoprotein M6-b isoform X4 [Lepidochelys kempii]|uniref:neuronal membrane glycoprotein M6-b isoform X4 n=1 Tax=Lepidochelys kempii TaxID=8472 RepID=UPI003C6FD0CF
MVSLTCIASESPWPPAWIYPKDMNPHGKTCKFSPPKAEATAPDDSTWKMYNYNAAYQDFFITFLSLSCFECCIKCLGGVPYASLVATILCFSGVALFCGCGHVALTGTVSILEQHFSTNSSDHALLSEVIQLMQYVIYGIASFFFLYGIILLAEGFYTTSAVKELHGEFKTTACGRCISGMFVFLTYVLGVAWLGVFGFSAVPVFMFYNIWSTCEVIKSLQTNMTASGDQICVDVRQYGIIPWNAVPGRACGPILENICNTNEIHFLMILSSNWAYLKDASKMQAYQDIKAKEEQELQDIQSRSKEQLNSYT